MNAKTLFLTAWLLAASLAHATEYFVSPQGRDANPGTAKDAAFLTVQKGVDTLKPGDTLTLAPGEYHEAIRREDLGSLDATTTIRAEISGTVTLRGDVPLAFSGGEAMDFPFQGIVPAVNELNTLTILKRVPNASEPAYNPGTFHHDAAAGKLYLSPSDMQPGGKIYTATTLATHGILLIRPRQVVIEGLNVTGFSGAELRHYREETGGGTWGIFLVHGKSCIIRDCRAYLNSWGIGMQSGPPGSGDNVVERCVAWGNKSQFANGDMGGITILAARRDQIRDCIAYRNGMYGINIYGTGGAAPNYKDDGGNLPENRSKLIRNLAWGNESADIKIKTGYEYHHEAIDCAAPGVWSVVNVTHGLMGRNGHAPDADSIVLEKETDFDPNLEFASPANHDYRLQSTSRFRGAGEGGKDRGPYPYKGNVFFVSPQGDDANNGLSVKTAWKTMDHALKNLPEGSTLYLEPGDYPSPPLAGKRLDIRERRGGVNLLGHAPVKLEPAFIDPPAPKLILSRQPAVLSVTATTANIEWFTSLPATCQLAWGETPACENTVAYHVNYFGSYSLTGLKPGQTYYFKVASIKRPADLPPKTESAPIELTDQPIRFTTLPQDAAPATYYVAEDGDDSKSGLDRANAWRHIHVAAERAKAGDTVLIAGGTYRERIRVRASGEEGRPITFKALPGEKVHIDGDNMALHTAFVVHGKKHLVFDGFYFARFNLFPNEGWDLQKCGEFHFYRSDDVRVSRCFSEGRGGYSAYPVCAIETSRLTLRNCVNTYKFGGMYFWRCPDLMIENSVFASPMIMAFVHRNLKDQKATMRNCIFTDMLEKKAVLNLGLLCCDGETEGFRHENNAYTLRPNIPVAERALNGKYPAARIGEYIVDPLFDDPRFAGQPAGEGGFGPDRMMDLNLALDFDSFFATNPEFMERGIGLQPEAFGDYRFE